MGFNVRLNGVDAQHEVSDRCRSIDRSIPGCANVTTKRPIDYSSVGKRAP